MMSTYFFYILFLHELTSGITDLPASISDIHETRAENGDF